ncbi:MAG: ABC-F family ATP-binding cassette domain-containing protein [Bacillota bacterium]|nr:ABC-F family ATP-binding cassette domain-containing protein [Bacillota bacterium]
MSVLNLQNVSMSFGERQLFSSVNLDVRERDKIGFVGANGVGKTTLFKIISGELLPPDGNVIVPKNAKIGYMEQHACKNPNRSLFEELLSVFEDLSAIENELEETADKIESFSGTEDDLHKLIEQQAILHQTFEREGGLTYKSRTRSALLGLGFLEKEFSIECGKLSGGQRSKLALSKLLLSKSGLLLLDEPTNHLDISSVEWLQNFISDYKGAIILISHDRYFLDAVTDRTIELENKKINGYFGNYSAYLKKKEAKQEEILKKYQSDMLEIKRIDGIIAQQRSFGRERNFITIDSKQKQIDRIKAELIPPNSMTESIHFCFQTKRESGNDVLICRDLSKSFGGKQLFHNVDMHIRKGERVFIIGSNGCGKTTLFKLLNCEIPADKGQINRGANVDIGYFDQVQANLNLENNCFDEISNAFPALGQTEIRTALGGFLIKGDNVFKQLSALSGGERARISLLKLMLKGANLLILDEPTNHLDTNSREQLEQTLSEYEGTLLIISHDRYFINKIADRVLLLTKDGLKEYLGNYDDYLEKSRNEEMSALQINNKKSKKKVNEYSLKKEAQSNFRKLNTCLIRCEEQIEDLEQEIENMDKEMKSDQTAADYERLMALSVALNESQLKLESMMDEWGRIQEEIGVLKNYQN